MAADRVFKLHVVTPYGIFAEIADCSLVELTSHEGIIGVMYGHVPMVIAIKPGLLRYKVADTFYNAFVSVGYATVQKEEVTVICNAAEWPEDIDTVRAQAGFARGREKFNDPQSSKIAKTHAKHAMRRAKARLHVAEVFQHQSNKSL